MYLCCVWTGEAYENILTLLRHNKRQILDNYYRSLKNCSCESNIVKSNLIAEIRNKLCLVVDNKMQIVFDVMRLNLLIYDSCQKIIILIKNI